MEYSSCTTWQVQLFAGPGCVEGLGTFFTRQAQFYDPEIRRKVSGEMQIEGCAILTCCAERSVHRSAGIDHHQVARVEERPDIPELRMHNAVVRTIRNHQAHFIARKPTRLWRLPSFEFCRKVEV